MDKFSQYVQILVNTLRWKRPDPNELPLDFINDIDQTAQKYGYKADAFGENVDKRAILFIKDKKDGTE